MRNLLNFLAKYNGLIIFLILEGIAFYLLSTENNYHNTRIVQGLKSITQVIEKRMSNTRAYFHLGEINQELADENASLKDSLERLSDRLKEKNLKFYTVSDTIYRQKYVYTAARVIDNSINRQKNFFTLDKGSKQGLMPGMVVVAGESVAGVIVGCSDNFSVVMSVLNTDFRLSARFKSNGYFGSLSWDGMDYSHAILSEIPQHVTFGIGDTIETTGYSATFPEGILIGTVNDFKKSGGDFYNIKVTLATDFKKLYYVNVIGNMEKEEQLELENSFQ